MVKNLGKKPTVKESKELKSKQDAQAAQMAVRQRMDEMAVEANRQLDEWAINTPYSGVLPANFSENVRKSMMHFSDIMLHMPYLAYKAICEVTDGKYSVMQMNNLIQVVSTASADKLGMDMETYISFKDELQAISGTLAQVLDDNTARVKAEVELQFTQTAGEA